MESMRGQGPVVLMFTNGRFRLPDDCRYAKRSLQSTANCMLGACRLIRFAAVDPVLRDLKLREDLFLVHAKNYGVVCW